jgi:hypothetical protein
MAQTQACDRSDCDIVQAVAGEGAAVTLLRAAPPLADGAAILLAAEGAARRVVQLSPPAFPDVVAEACDRTAAFAHSVGPALAHAMVRPIEQGIVEQRSYAVLPFHQALSDSRLMWLWQRGRIGPALLDWLAMLAGLGHRGAGEDYAANLAALVAMPGIGEELHEAAVAAIAQLAADEAIAVHVPMHGDLWRGNILKAADDSAWPFALIDWRGSRVDGYPVYDLVRLADSLHIRPRRLGIELRRHAAALGCTADTTEVHLLAALGHYARHLGEMPVSAFDAMARTCLALHRRALAAA